MKDLFNSTQEKEYIQLFNDIKSHVQRAHVKAVKAVSSEMVALYWQIGGLVLERQELYGWGKSVVDKLSSDLQREYHDKTGFSPSNIWRMRQMHQEYSDTSILAQVVRELKCAEKDSIEVEYALRVINKPVGVAQYQLTNDLPFDLKSEFPDLLELKNRLLNQARKE